MTGNWEEAAEAELVLDDRAVVDYLQRHPEFFIRNARVVEQMQVPHPVRGTVSLVEWHMARTRNQISLLENGIQHLQTQAAENEALFQRLLRLQENLATATSLDELLARLQRWARDLGLTGVSIRLFSDRWQLGPPAHHTHLALSRQAFEGLRIQRLGYEQHYLGTLNGAELSLLQDDANSTGSVALSLLGRYGDLGVILFSSSDPQHYQSGQGTQLLQEIACLLPALLERWIQRR